MKVYSFALILTFVWVLSSCSIQPLSFDSIDKPAVNKLNTQNTEIGFKFGVKNPNSLGFKIVKSNVVVTANNIEIGKLILDKKTRIRRKSTSTIPLSVHVDNSKMLAVTAMALFGDPTVRIKGSFKARKFFFSKKIEIDHSEKVSINDFLEK